MKKVFVVLLSLMVIIGLALTPVVFAQEDKVYVVKINGDINPGLAKYIERGYREAALAGAKQVILEINTPGGLVDSALKIKDTVSRSKIPTTAFVDNRALSAGALIALSSSRIAMVPGATMGAAEPRVGTKRADEKFVSAWSAELEGAAASHGRDGRIAAGMADADLVIPGLKEKGKLITLTAEQAVKLKMADLIVQDRSDLLNRIGLAGAQVFEVMPSTAEQAAGFITNPFVSPLFLTIGIAGLVIELFTLGWGVAGLLGLTSLGLYFGGHLIAGMSGWEAVLFFIIGVILLVIEVFVAGFGVFGIAGLASIAASVVLVSNSVEHALISLTVSIIGTLLLLAVALRFLVRRNLFQRVILNQSQQTREGYRSASVELEKYVGLAGTALTPLRPAGSADINGVRIDVVTEGDFIPRGSNIKVVKVEGGRVVVKKIEQS